MDHEYRTSAALGILYAEDFDLEIEPDPSPEPAPGLAEPEPAAPPALTRADLDAACIQAVEAARAAWAESAGERRAAALESLAAGLANARRDASEAAEAATDGIARTALGMVASLLPELCAAHGDKEVRALVGKLLPSVARTGPVVIRANPELVGLLRADLDALNDGLLDTVELRPANLPAGDVRLSWDEGSLARDTAAIRKAIEAGLSQLGLLASPEPTPTLQDAWSFAYAE